MALGKVCNVEFSPILIPFQEKVLTSVGPGAASSLTLPFEYRSVFLSLLLCASVANGNNVFVPCLLLMLSGLGKTGILAWKDPRFECFTYVLKYFFVSFDRLFAF